MAELALDRPHRNPILVVHGCESFAEPMQALTMAARLIRAGLSFLIDAFATIQASAEGRTLQYAEEMPVRFSVEPKDEADLGYRCRRALIRSMK